MDVNKFLATTRGRIIAALAGVAVLAIGVPVAVTAASKPSRSVDAFCGTYYQQMHKMWDMAHMQTGTPLGDAFQYGAAVSEMPVMFDALDKVAPDTIEPDVANIYQALQNAEQSAGSGDALSALAGGLAATFESMGSWENFTLYVQNNCPIQKYDPQLYRAQQAAAKAANNAQVAAAEKNLAGGYRALQSVLTKMQGLNWNNSWTLAQMAAALAHERRVLANIQAVASAHDCTKTDAMINGALRNADNAVSNVKEDTTDSARDITSSAASELRSPELDSGVSNLAYYEGPLTEALKSAPGAKVQVTVAMANNLIAQGKAMEKRFDSANQAQSNQISHNETVAAHLEFDNAYKLDQMACG